MICGRMLELQNEDMKNKIEHIEQIYENKLNSAALRLEKMKISLEYAKRPLYRKIGGKIYYTIFPKKKQEAGDKDQEQN